MTLAEARIAADRNEPLPEAFYIDRNGEVALKPCATCLKRPRIDRAFMVCQECWDEHHKDERPLMPWEI